MGMRDWLIIIVIVGIILILLDGYRRKRKDRIRVKLDKNIPSVDADHVAAQELPNGGARIVNRNGELIDDEEGEEGYQDYDDDEGYEDFKEDEQEEGVLDEEDQVVPVLMDAVDIADRNVADSPSHYDDNELDGEDYEEEHTDEEESENFVENTAEEDAEELEELEEVESTKAYSENDFDEGEEISAVRTSPRQEQQSSIESARSVSTQGRIEPTLGEIDAFSEVELDEQLEEAAETDAPDETPVNDQAELFAESPEDFIQDDEDFDEEEDYIEPEEVIVINVMAKQGELFAGSDLLPIFLQQGLQLGKMSIFHKHADNSGNGPIMFSMANMLKPGTFDVTQMEEFSTPGVSFFLQLPNAFGNMLSFEQMLSAAESIKNSLDGDLKDEHRSVITRQTIDHCRQRIQDFELAQLSKK